MAKWKSKIMGKVFTEKKPDFNENGGQPNNQNGFFRNVVPPNNSQAINNEKNGFHEIKNVQVTSSYVIPLQEQLNPLHQNIPPQPSYYQQPVIPKMDTMALVTMRNSFKIPKAISFEIRIEKLKQLFLIFLSSIFMTITSTFIAFYFKQVYLQYTPHPAIMIPLLIISTTIALVNLVDFFALKKSVNLYIDKTLQGSLIPPNFIISNYRKIHGRIIILNWLFTFCYITLGISTGIMFLISGQKLTFLVQSWTVTVPDLYKDATTIAIVLGIILILHMLAIVLFKKRKSNILSHYGYEIINPNDLEAYKKKINRICLIITLSFLAIIFFAIAIPIWIVRKRKQKL